MKTCRIVLTGLLAAVLSVAFAGNAGAQENGNRDSLGRIVRGPYETNGAWDNWFIGVGGGINLFEDGWFGAMQHRTRVAPAIEVNVGKWFTPSVGARIGYSGFRANGWNQYQTAFATEFNDTKNMYKEKVNFAYVRTDVMWNISNAFSGYKETRFWNVIPYLSAGYLHGYGTAGVTSKSHQFAYGGGIYNTLRISKFSMSITRYRSHDEVFHRCGEDFQVHNHFGPLVQIERRVEEQQRKQEDAKLYGDGFRKG